MNKGRRFFCVFRRFSKQFQSAWEVRAWRALTVEERVDLLRFDLERNHLFGGIGHGVSGMWCSLHAPARVFTSEESTVVRWPRVRRPPGPRLHWVRCLPGLVVFLPGTQVVGSSHSRSHGFTRDTRWVQHHADLLSKTIDSIRTVYESLGKQMMYVWKSLVLLRNWMIPLRKL